MSGTAFVMRVLTAFLSMCQYPSIVAESRPRADSVRGVSRKRLTVRTIVARGR